MRSAVRAATGIAPFPIIPLFAEGPTHPFVPLGRRPAGARSEGQGRPSAGASRAPFTGASTLACWRRGGGGLVVAIAALLVSGVAAPFAASAQNAPIERETARHPYNAHDNIMAGAAYLRELHDRYGDVTAMLAAYNAGPGRYDEHLSRGRPLPGETVAYLAKLAPITGGAGETQLAAAPALDPFAWRRAALFAVRSAAPSTAQPHAENDVLDVQAERPLTEGAGVAMAAITPPSSGLFVPVSRRSPQ